MFASTQRNDRSIIEVFDHDTVAGRISQETSALAID